LKNIAGIGIFVGFLYVASFHFVEFDGFSAGGLEFLGSVKFVPDSKTKNFRNHKILGHNKLLIHPITQKI
jgi:hypothetical protein